MRDVIEELAQALHETYLEQRLAAGDDPGTQPSLQRWETLPEHFRDSSRRQAREVREIMEGLGYEVAPASSRSAAALLPDDEVEQIARDLHSRWVAERTAAGWRHGSQRDDERLVHPDLVPWGDLSEERREIDRHLARALPRALLDAGLALERARPGARR